MASDTASRPAPPRPAATTDTVAPETGAERVIRLADACVLCGLCLPHCPTYAADRIEAESPRGRIVQFRALAEGRLAPTPTGLAHLDHCLGCRNCEPVCPAGVRYGALLVEGRTLLRARRRWSPTQRLLEWAVARPRVLAAGAALTRVLAPVLPRRLRALARTLAPHRKWPATVGAEGPRRGRVALLLGCVGRVAQPAAIDAALAVLRRLGWEVALPPALSCCGALARHAGNADEATRLGRRNATAFASAGVDHVLVLDSGCVESLRHGLAADGGLATAPAVHELLAFVAADAQLDRLQLRAPAGDTVVLHLPCTQRNVSGGADAAVALAQRACGRPPVLVGSSGCCGAAGTQLLLDPARAALFRAPLLDAIEATGATRVASGNVGCRMHLQAGLDARPGGYHGRPGTAPRVVHPIELLAERMT